MKALLLLSLVATLAACEAATDSVTPRAETTLQADDLRGIWAFRDVSPDAAFRPDQDSAGLDWARSMYVGHARVELLPDGQFRWQFTKQPQLFSERLLDTTLVYGSFQLRQKGTETWLDLTDCDTDYLRLSQLGNTLWADDPAHHLRLTLVREQ